MAYKISTTHQFEKDLKRCIKRGYPMDEFRTVIQLLERDGRLPEVYRPHMLHGDRQGQWECHIQPNWLLIYRIEENILVLELVDTGSHSNLFKK